jgi:hypothetical protein
VIFPPRDFEDCFFAKACVAHSNDKPAMTQVTCFNFILYPLLSAIEFQRRIQLGQNVGIGQQSRKNNTPPCLAKWGRKFLIFISG